MNCDRNYENMLNFIKVMPKILLVPFFRTRCIHGWSSVFPWHIEGTYFCLGDFNAVWGTDRSPVVGPAGSGTPNYNTDCLLGFCSGNGLRISGSWFHRRDIHRLTWFSNDGCTAKEIDHVLCNGRHWPQTSAGDDCIKTQAIPEARSSSTTLQHPQAAGPWASAALLSWGVKPVFGALRGSLGWLGYIQGDKKRWILQPWPHSG